VTYDTYIGGTTVSPEHPEYDGTTGEDRERLRTTSAAPAPPRSIEMDLLEVARRNTRLFLNCVSDLPEDRAATRAGQSTNSIEFLVLHLIDVRFYLARYIGLEAEHPYAERLEAAQGILDVDEFPPLAEMVGCWERISDALHERLEHTHAADLEQKSDQRFPLSGRTVGSGIVFLLGHEMYHIGQLGLLRKHAGLPAMKWS
jgi:uncharacterized damage-inducible protein DinB